MNKIITTTTSSIEGRPITEYLGVISGEAIIGANIIKDIFASIRDVVGGRSDSYERVLREARQEALIELQERAMENGADAIVNLRFDYESLGSNGAMLMVIADATAVKLG